MLYSKTTINDNIPYKASETVNYGLELDNGTYFFNKDNTTYVVDSNTLSIKSSTVGAGLLDYYSRGFIPGTNGKIYSSYVDKSFVMWDTSGSSITYNRYEIDMSTRYGSRMFVVADTKRHTVYALWRSTNTSSEIIRGFIYDEISKTINPISIGTPSMITSSGILYASNWSTNLLWDARYIDGYIYFFFKGIYPNSITNDVEVVMEYNPENSNITMYGIRKFPYDSSSTSSVGLSMDNSNMYIHTENGTKYLYSFAYGHIGTNKRYLIKYKMVPNGNSTVEWVCTVPDGCLCMYKDISNDYPCRFFMKNPIFKEKYYLLWNASSIDDNTIIYGYKLHLHDTKYIHRSHPVIAIDITNGKVAGIVMAPFVLIKENEYNYIPFNYTYGNTAWGILDNKLVKREILS